jgi:iron complex transport system substrate-binding protein
MRARRRIPLLLVCFGLLAAGLAACGSSDETTGGGSETSAAGAEADAFPVTIEHKWGSTTIDAPPERVVVAGLREQDALLALGVVPVATTEWLGEHPGEIYPWAEDELGNAPLPEVLDFGDRLQFEAIAAERPDLIIAVYSALSRQDYDKLSAIAPTVAQPRGQIDWAASWQDEILTVGTAVGKPAKAQRLLDEAESEIAAVARRHPEFKGATGLVGGDDFYIFGREDPRSKLLVDLGFEFPPALSDFGGDEYGAVLPDEEVSKLDVDAMVWLASTESAERIREHPVYSGLDVRTRGRDIFVDPHGAFYESSSFITVLSIPTLLEGLEPRLASAVDGDPQTKTDESSQ